MGLRGSTRAPPSACLGAFSALSFGMADAELVRVLDYILNRSDDASIEAVAAAVVRRKRDLALYGSAGLPDPRSYARAAAARLSGGSALAGIRETVRGLASDLLRKEAPELEDAQIEELLGAWVPSSGAGADGESAEGRLPPDVLSAMADQFTAYSLGLMDEASDRALREQLGSWPERYWAAFPPVVRAFITEFLRGGTDEEEFRSKLRAALDTAAD